MATEASNKAAEVKAAVEDMTNVFSHDETGAHVGDKTAAHVTVNSRGMGIYNAEAQIASFESDIISLNNSALNIVAGYQDDEGNRATALMTSNILLKPTGHLLSDSQAIGARMSSSDRMHFAEIGLTDSALTLSADNRAKKESIDYTNLIKLLKFVPWTDLVNTSSVRVRYCVRGGVMYISCFLDGTGGAYIYTTKKQIPNELLPAESGYFPLGTQTGNNTAKIWLGAAGGGDGHVYIYNWSSGYCYGVIPVIPKSLE